MTHSTNRNHPLDLQFTDTRGQRYITSYSAVTTIVIPHGDSTDDSGLVVLTTGHEIEVESNEARRIAGLPLINHEETAAKNF